jgi:geranylgeranyl pyrophosphate synthase
LKTDLEAVGSKKLCLQKLKEHELWFPLCFLLHECLPEGKQREISEKLQNEFDAQEFFEELNILFKKYEVSNQIHDEAELELKQAKEFLKQLEFDSGPLQPLTQYSMI